MAQQIIYPLSTQPTIRVPPIKTQGIKTKLVQFIRDTINTNGVTRWVEPFLGSGVVAFNIKPKKALMGESNPYIINFYKAIQDGVISAKMVREYLSKEGNLLEVCGEKHYYSIRERFNRTHNPLDFLFLNRAGFNGLIRFNSKGGYNVPFCRKPKRFSKSYITKITNQVAWIESILCGNMKWKLLSSDWRDVVRQTNKGDFIYLDPPYSGRDTNYYSAWGNDDLKDLARFLSSTECRFGLSLWYENRYRKNEDVDHLFGGFHIHKHEHFYHVGATENLRNSITEVLITN